MLEIQLIFIVNGEDVLVTVSLLAPMGAAREQAQRERETLKAELAALRRGQAKRIATDAAAAARGIVVRLLERIEGPDLEQALVTAASRELAKLAAGGPVAPVIVESAGALDPAVLDALARAAGVARSEMSARRVPELGAGIRILTARGLIDASAAGLAAHAERALVARLEQGELPEQGWLDAMRNLCAAMRGARPEAEP